MTNPTIILFIILSCVLHTIQPLMFWVYAQTYPACGRWILLMPTKDSEFFFYNHGRHSAGIFVSECLIWMFDCHGGNGFLFCLFEESW